MYWCVCVCVFQGHGDLRDRVWRRVPDGGGGGLLSVRVHVREERTGSTRGRVQHLLCQHSNPGLPG